MNGNMNLLFLVPYTPTPIRTRPYNLLRQLLRRGHSVTLGTLWTSPEEHAALADLTSMGLHVIAMPLPAVRIVWNCARALSSTVPVQSRYCWLPNLASRVAAEAKLGRFDLVHVEHLRGAEYGLYLMSTEVQPNGRPPFIWDSVDCISLLFAQAAEQSHSILSRAMARFELPRTRHFEARMARTFDRTLVASTRDQIAFEELVRKAPDAFAIPTRLDERRTSPFVSKIRNGVDLDYFAPFEGDRSSRTIVMTGKMSYHANVTAAQYLIGEIMPRVWRETPDTLLQVVGQNPPAQLHRLAREAKGPVQITGTVSDLRPYLRSAAVAVAPILYGAGIQNKLLEAMAIATPVIATPVALEGLAIRPDEDALVAANAEEFCRQIVRLESDPELARQIGRNGRRYVESNHDWRQVAGELESVYHEETDRAHTRP